MTFTIRELRRAKEDKREIVEWMYEQSQSGAIAWLAAYDSMIAHLKIHADAFSEADENADLVLDVRQAFFKTRRGRIYRALFVIDSGEVFVLRVRGPGQAPIDSKEIDEPEN